VKAAVLTWYRLRWPREVEPEQVTQAFRLLATTAGGPVVVEAVGSPAGVEYRLAVPTGQADVIADQLRATIPGLAVEGAGERPPIAASRDVELRLSTKHRLLRTDDLAEVSRAVLTALAHVRDDELLCVQWVLAGALVAVAVPNRLDGMTLASWLGALLLGSSGSPAPMSRLPCWRGIAAGSAIQSRRSGAWSPAGS
jgi:hypothetical protein